MQQHCYTHKDQASVAMCSTCSKNYCATCLSLIGKVKMTCCTECYALVRKRTKKAIFRKWLLTIITALAAIILFLATHFGIDILENWSIYFILLVGFVIFNIIKIRQFKEVLITQDYGS